MEFSGRCNRVYVQDVTREDMIDYQDWLLKRGLAKNTAGKKLRRLSQFYRTVMGLKLGDGLVTMADETKDIEEIPEVFEESALVKFFAACDAEDHLLFSVFLESGFRMQEVMHLTWDDVKFGDGVLCVTPKTVAKQGFNFTPKTRECRQVPVSTDLIERLKAFRERQAAGQGITGKHSILVFPNRNANPQAAMLEMCKVIGSKAGLTREECWLHKFRATMATRWLRKADLVTVQYLLGHKNISTTQRYLAPVKNANLRDLANAMSNGK